MPIAVLHQLFPSFRPGAFLLCLFLAVFMLGLAADTQAAPSFEQQYEKNKAELEQLKNDPRRKDWREPWEALAASFLELHDNYPRWRNRAAALYRSALAMEELSQRSMLRQDAQTALSRYENFLKLYDQHVLADDALFGIARIKAERFRDFPGSLATLQRLQQVYPRGDIASEASVYAQRLTAGLEAAKNADSGKRRRATLTALDWETQKNLVTVTLDFDRPVIWSILSRPYDKKTESPSRLIVNLSEVSPGPTVRPGVRVQGSHLRRIRMDLSPPEATRLLLDFSRLRRFTVRTEKPSRLVITAAATDAALPKGIAVGQGIQSTDPLFRFSSCVVMLDPGHGGKDPGSFHNGIVERDVTLDLAKRVGAFLANQGVDVRYTRTDNTWVSLDTRCYMANKARADFFVSIHVNANPNESACGVETYFMDTAATADAARLAGVENANGPKTGTESSPAASLAGTRVGASRNMAEIVQKAILARLKGKEPPVRDGGIKAAPLKVLLGINMPGVLVEAGYCSNPQEAQHLANPAYRETLSEGIASGILAYIAANGGSSS